jgi:hypothetical protein
MYTCISATTNLLHAFRLLFNQCVLLIQGMKQTRVSQHLYVLFAASIFSSYGHTVDDDGTESFRFQSPMHETSGTCSHAESHVLVLQQLSPRIALGSSYYALYF